MALFGDNLFVTILIVCPFLIVAAFTLPIILVRYLRGDFRDKEDENDKDK
ncbi:MAG: hypothetical protein IJ571_10760 [Ruminococcus sp.]|nr:hypothetical protein [Ruminococcus sp.]